MRFALKFGWGFYSGVNVEMVDVALYFLYAFSENEVNPPFSNNNIAVT